MALALDIPRLETDRLILRVPSAADTRTMLSFLGSDRARFYGGPMGPDDAWHKFAAYVGQWILRGYGMYSVVLKDSGETVGMAGPHHPDHFEEPELSWLLTEARFEGRGLATEACKAVLCQLFTTLGWKTVVSYIDIANVASRKLAEGLGARLDPNSKPAIANCDTYRHIPQAGAK